MSVIRTGFCLCLVGVWLPLAVSGAEVAKRTGEVRGRVVNRDGRGVAAAKVQLREEVGDTSLALATSGADGEFVMRSVAVGVRLRVLIDAEGFGREHRDPVHIFPNRATDLGQIRMFPGCVCEGRVLSAEGQPVAGAKVVVEPFRRLLGHTIQALGPAWEVESDAEGRYATPPLPPCYALFNVKPAAGLVTARTETHSIEPSASRLQVADLQLLPEVPVEGLVVDKLGSPIADADVWCNPGAAGVVKTDARGRFTLRGLNAKTILRMRIGVDAAGFASYFESEPNSELPRRIVLAPCGYLSGRAVDAETGEPVKLRRVVVCDVRRDADGKPHSYGCGEARFVESAKGLFRISVSQQGEKHLTVMAEGYHRAEQYVLGFDLLRDVPELTIKMRREGSSATAAGQRIRGMVRSGNRPAANVWVSLWGKHKEVDPANAWIVRGRTVDGTYHRCWGVDVLTAADGGYLLDLADPGEYYVVATPSEGAPAISQPVVMRADEQRTCDLDLVQGVTVRGRVAGVAPEVAEQLWVVAFGRVPFRAAAPLDRSGEFVLKNVPSGEIGLKVGHEGHLDADVPRYPWPKDIDVFSLSAEPWRRAVAVIVGAEAVTGIELEYPASGPPDQRDD
jgi:hypothetical protein